ncbi:MAG: lysophospholipid acyltransferase family protein [Paracoccaceae bacterium]
MTTPRGGWRGLADRAETAAARVLLAASAPLSTDRLVRVAGAVGGAVLPRIPPLRRRIEGNLAALGAEARGLEAGALEHAVGDHFARVIAEYMRLDEIAADPTRLEVEDDAPLADALASGRGVVLVSAHHGNWEAVRLAVRRHGRDCALIYRAFNNPRFDALAQDLIRRAGEPVLHKGREGTRALLRHVARGGVALILIDQRQTGAPLLPFLGREAETSTAAAELAVRFGAALVPARARRLPDGRRFGVRFGPEIPAGDPVAMTATANDVISDWIREDPGQWFWLHRRWLLRPRGAGIRAARGR